MENMCVCCKFNSSNLQPTLEKLNLITKQIILCSSSCRLNYSQCSVVVMTEGVVEGS